MPPKSRTKQPAAAQKRKRRDEPVSEDDGYNSSTAEDDDQALDSDNLDDDDDDGKKGEVKRRRKKASPAKSRKRRKGGSDEEESDLELKEGQEVVGKIVRAPKTGQGEPEFARIIINPPRSFPSTVPPGQISQNTFNFLIQLGRPECNDREWLVPILAGISTLLIHPHSGSN